MPHKLDIGSDENIMPVPIYKKLFPRATKGQLAATKNDNIQLQMYNRKTVTQIGMCKVKLQYINEKINFM